MVEISLPIEDSRNNSGPISGSVPISGRMPLNSLIDATRAFTSGNLGGISSAFSVDRNQQDQFDLWESIPEEFKNLSHNYFGAKNIDQVNRITGLLLQGQEDQATLMNTTWRGYLGGMLLSEFFLPQK